MLPLYCLLWACVTFQVDALHVLTVTILYIFIISVPHMSGCFWHGARDKTAKHPSMLGLNPFLVLTNEFFTGSLSVAQMVRFMATSASCSFNLVTKAKQLSNNQWTIVMVNISYFLINYLIVKCPLYLYVHFNHTIWWLMFYFCLMPQISLL